MDELTLWKIRYKYKNKIFPRFIILINKLSRKGENKCALHFFKK